MKVTERQLRKPFWQLNELSRKKGDILKVLFIKNGRTNK